MDEEKGLNNELSALNTEGTSVMHAPIADEFEELKDAKIMADSKPVIDPVRAKAVTDARTKKGKLDPYNIARDHLIKNKSYEKQD